MVPVEEYLELGARCLKLVVMDTRVVSDGYARF